MSELFDFKFIDEAFELDGGKRIATKKAVEVCTKLMPGTRVTIDHRDVNGRRVIARLQMYSESGNLIFTAPSAAKLLRYVSVQAVRWRDDKKFINTSHEKTYSFGTQTWAASVL